MRSATTSGAGGQGARSSPLGPGGRPLRGWRVVPMALALVALAANLVILLSDRAPGVFRRISDKIDAGVNRASGVAGTPADVRVPQSDFDVHVALWGVAAVLVGLAMWSWLSLLLASVTLFAVSVVVEGSQAVLTTSRTVQGADVAANLLGVASGTAVVVVFAVLWRPARARPARTTG